MRTVLVFFALLAPAGLAQSVEFNPTSAPSFRPLLFLSRAGRGAAEKQTAAGCRAGSPGGNWPGRRDRSAVYQRITETNKARRMPPAYAGHDALSAGDIQKIRTWIEQRAAGRITGRSSPRPNRVRPRSTI